METRTKAIAIGAGVVALGVGAFFILSGNADLPGIPDLSEPARCPLMGVEPKNESAVERPAVALKIENSAVARPLSGLEKADLVFEELVEGGETRFMAIFHCRDAAKAGPIRSARQVDPGLLRNTTRILAYSGANQTVQGLLEDAGLVTITESEAGGAMERVPREGVSSEHTLYADSSAIRRLGRKDYDDVPPDDIFEFGDLEGNAKRARSITINFGGASTITYEYSGGVWLRSQDGVPFTAESGGRLAPENILIESHRVNLSEVVDVTGTPSPIIADETGSGRAILFREGRAVVGRWVRESLEDPVRYETKDGDAMVLAPGSVWVELVPNEFGDVKGSYDYAK